MVSNSSETGDSESDVEALVHEEVAAQPDTTIVAVWEPEDGGVFVAVERPGPEDQPLQTLYRVTLEPTVDSGDQLHWAWLGPYTPN